MGPRWTVWAATAVMMVVVGGSDTSIITASPAPTVSPTRWALIGDSITAMNDDEWYGRFAARDLTRPVVAAWPGGMTDRRTAGRYSYVPSGVDSVARVRTVMEPDWWVIELGNNDAMNLEHCGCDQVAEAGARIDHLRSVLGSEARVIWVTVHDDVFPHAAAAFDIALAERASRTFVLLDWARLSAHTPTWFFDGRHPNAAGAAAMGDAIAGAVGAAPALRLPSCPDPQNPIRHPTTVAAAAAVMPAVRCIA